MSLGSQGIALSDNELVPADTDFLPIGSIIPFLRNRVEKGFEEFDGRELKAEDYPKLWEALRDAYDGIQALWEGWGGEVDQERRMIKLPDIDKETVVKMLWGVEYENAPDTVLAIKAESNGSDN